MPASVATTAVIFIGLENNCSSDSSLLLPACVFLRARQDVILQRIPRSRAGAQNTGQIRNRCRPLAIKI
ncbi:hypothetical protein C3766_05585 [Heyndrickxia coagulans]|nr:hypothetical protein C3766_05585 [Heyndrickxia coagulans]